MEIKSNETRFIIACYEDGKNAFNYWRVGDKLNLDEKASDALAFRLRDIGLFDEPAYSGEGAFTERGMVLAEECYTKYAAKPKYWTDEQRRFLRRIYLTTNGHPTDVYVEAMSIGAEMTAKQARAVAEELERRGVIELTAAMEARVSRSSLVDFLNTFGDEKALDFMADEIDQVRNDFLVAALEAEPKGFDWRGWIEANGHDGREDRIIDPIRDSGYIGMFNSLGMKLSESGRTKAREISIERRTMERQEQEAAASPPDTTAEDRLDIPVPDSLPIPQPREPAPPPELKANRIAAFFNHNIISGIIATVIGTLIVYAIVIYVYRTRGVNLNDPTTGGSPSKVVTPPYPAQVSPTPVTAATQP